MNLTVDVSLVCRLIRLVKALNAPVHAVTPKPMLMNGFFRHEVETITCSFSNENETPKSDYKSSLETILSAFGFLKDWLRA